MLNKKGQVPNAMMFTAFFFIIVIIVVAIAAAVFIFFGYGYDFRVADARVLNSKIADCLIDNPVPGNNFLEVCGLNQTIIEKYYTIKICTGADADKDQTCIESQSSIFYSGSNFETCLIVGAQKNVKFPSCYINNFELKGSKYIVITSNKQNSRRTKA